jgi:hypothetical protein
MNPLAVRKVQVAELRFVFMSSHRKAVTQRMLTKSENVGSDHITAFKNRSYARLYTVSEGVLLLLVLLKDAVAPAKSVTVE